VVPWLRIIKPEGLKGPLSIPGILKKLPGSYKPPDKNKEAVPPPTYIFINAKMNRLSD
jgi:hypothetical protein